MQALIHQNSCSNFDLPLFPTPSTLFWNRFYLANSSSPAKGRWEISKFRIWGNLVLGSPEEEMVEWETKDLSNSPLHSSQFIIITFLESDDLTNVLLTVSSIKAATYVSFFLLESKIHILYWVEEWMGLS